MTTTGLPAGWYRDPSARHEQRYWDGGQWSSDVLDGPSSGEDELAASAGSVVHFAPGVGYRVFRFPFWRRLLIVLALLTVGTALVLAGTAAILLRAFGPTPSPLEQWIFYWVYGSTADGGAMRLPSPALWVGLALAMAAVGVSMANRQTTLMKAGGKVGRLWSSREDKQRWQAALHALTAADVGWTVRYGLRGWLCLAAAAIGSATVLVIAADTVASRYGLSPTGNLPAGSHLGLSPWLSLIAGVAGLVAVTLALPWRLGGEIAVYPNGRVRPVDQGAATTRSPVDAAPPIAGAAPPAVGATPPDTSAVVSTDFPAAQLPTGILPAAAAQSVVTAQADDNLRLAAVREFALSSRTPGQMARRLALAPAGLAALLERRSLRFSSGAIGGYTYTGRDRSTWEASKQQLFDDLVADKGASGVLKQAKSVTPDWFTSPGGELFSTIADIGGLGISLEAKDRQPIPANERRLAWVGLAFSALLIGITFGMAIPVGWLWQASYFGWRDASRQEPRAAAALGLIGLLPVALIAALAIFSLVIAPVLLLFGVA